MVDYTHPSTVHANAQVRPAPQLRSQPPLTCLSQVLRAPRRAVRDGHHGGRPRQAGAPKSTLRPRASVRDAPAGFAGGGGDTSTYLCCHRASDGQAARCLSGVLPSVNCRAVRLTTLLSQAAFELIAARYPGAFAGYKMSVTESHQSSKVRCGYPSGAGVRPSHALPRLFSSPPRQTHRALPRRWWRRSKSWAPSSRWTRS